MLIRFKEELRAFDALLYVPNGYTLDHVGKCRNVQNSGLLASIARRETLQERYEQLLDEFLTQKDHFERAFLALSDIEAEILREYYFRGKTWADVAASLDLSESWMFKLHKRALTTLKESIQQC